MDVSLFDFELPEERIALRPASPRDSARLLVVHPMAGWNTRQVRDLPDYLTAGDAMVINDTRDRCPAAAAQRVAADAVRPAIEILLHRRLGARSFSGPGAAGPQVGARRCADI